MVSMLIRTTLTMVVDSAPMVMMALKMVSDGDDADGGDSNV